jgi:type II secretory ATPase GspE/PulE/Tfp pilus assembly ATPase PilB-like protein
MEQVILKNPTEAAVYEVARRNGMFTMKEDAMLKMFQGKIPFEEVNTLGGELVVDEPEQEVVQSAEPKP